MTSLCCVGTVLNNNNPRVYNQETKTYRRTAQTKGKNPKAGKFGPGGSEMGDGILFCIFVQKSPLIDEDES
jgi:hypothetical protein